jgi:hypothetical protein
MTLLGLSDKPALPGRADASATWTRWSFFDFEKTKTSSRYTKQVLHLTPERIISIALLKVAGAFLNPNGSRGNP